MRKALAPAFAVWLLLLSQFTSAQPWLYDFGTTTAAFTSGASTTFFTGTPTGGGTYRVRVGTAGGGFTLANPGTTLGTGSELQLNAASTTSSNKFTVYDWNGPTALAYSKFKVRTTSSGNGILWFHLGNGLGVFQDNTGAASYTNSLAVFYITYTSGAISSVTRRDLGSTAAITGHGFLKDTDQEVAVFGNNSSSNTSYHFQGATYQLAPQSWDLWVDGVKISPASGWARASGTTSIAANASLAGIGFMGESSTGNAARLHLDDLEYSNALPVSTAPAIATPVPAVLSGFSTLEGAPSTSQTFSVSATDLVADLVIAAPAGYELREAGIGTYATTLLLTPVDGAVTASVDVRLDGTTAGIYNGNVTLNSTGATERSVAVSGEVIEAGLPDCEGIPDGPAQPGTSCNDGDPCTINDTWGIDCICAGTFQDTDGDGVCDAEDECPLDPLKVVPGDCGCGQLEVGASCNDGDPCTVDDEITACGVCEGTPLPDTDGDGVCDEQDGCPLDPLKIAPGVCGCGNPEPGTACDDMDPETINDQIKADCTCAGVLPSIYWNFDSATRTSNLIANTSVSVVSHGNNNGTTTLITTGTASTGYSGASGGGNAGAAARIGALNTGADGSAYFQFTITPAPDHVITVDSLAFGSRSTGTGPLAYTLRSSLDDYASNIATGTLTASSTWIFRSNAFSVSGAPGQAVTFRLFGHNGAGGATAGTANWRIDDLNVFGSSELPAPTIATPVPAFLAGFSTVEGTPSAAQTFNVSASYLDADLVIEAPAGYELRVEDFGTFGTTLTLSPEDGEVLATVEVRLDGTLAGIYIGNVTLNSTGATEQTVAVSGEVIEAGLPDCEGTPDGPAQPGTACNDGDPCTINDTWDDNCVCAGTFQDTDGDGVCDAEDECPLDPLKVVPGDCGCGQLEVGASCNDGDPCTVDDEITACGVCEGTPLPDTDGDGVCDEQDGCPLDPLKIAPGVCGCGEPEPGTACDDLDPLTINDQITGDCTCAGVLPNIYWNFDSATRTYNLIANTSVSDISHGNNNGTTVLINNTSPSSGYAGASGGNNAGAAARTGALNTGTDGSAYFEITITPDPGHVLTVEKITFGSRRTSTGPQAYSLRSSLDGFTTDLSTGSFTAVTTWVLHGASSLAVTGSTGQPVTFRLYGYNGTGSPGANTANWRIDDLNVSGYSIVPAPSIAAPVPAALTGFYTIEGTPSAAQTFTVSASDLDDDLVIAAPLGYELREDGIGTYATTLMLPPVDGAVSATVEVRLDGIDPGIYNGNVTLNSIGAVERTVSVSGEVIEAGTPDCEGTPDGSAQPGTACNDGDPCTINDTWGEDCVCAGTFQDTDGDGVCDAEDECPLDPLKVVPGDCGCGELEVGASCNDGDPCTVDDQFIACGTCAGTPLPDTDGDGVCDEQDGCPLDPLKIAPGICGCGEPEPGTACDDLDPLTINDQITGDCTCAGVYPNIYWDFTTATATVNNVANTVVSDLSRGNNNGTTTLITTGSASSGYVGASGTGNAGAAARTGSLNHSVSASGSTYFEFTITPDPGYAVSIFSISFGSRSTGTGPLAYTVRSSLDNYATDVATGTLTSNSTWIYRSSTLMTTSLSGQPVTFRLYGHDGVGSPGANTANWRIDDLNVQGYTEEAAAQPVAGFNSAVSSVDEDGVTTSIGITMDVAPDATVIVEVTDAATGSALAGVDYLYSTTQLTFETTDTYPYTQYVEVTPVDNSAFEPNKTVVLELALIQGDAALAITTHTLTIVEDDLPSLVINEIDYDQPGPDTGEFIEIMNNGTTPVDLLGIQLILVNGANEQVYSTVSLPNVSLAPGAYHVVCYGNNAAAYCDQTVTTAIQNGDPDGVRLQTTGGNIIDQMSYGGVMSTTEGTSAPTISANFADLGLSRIPDGVDTDDNGADFLLACTTPGAPNVWEDSDGDGVNDCMDRCPGGPEPGTACDDGDPNTVDDIIRFDCTCQGIQLDCLGEAGGPAMPGTACNDGNPMTVNDVYQEDCTCAGEMLDCLGVAGGEALPGTPCDDGDPDTVDDTWSAMCVCEGSPAGSYVEVAARAVLDGAYDAATSLMRDDLRVLGLIPSAQPYGVFSHTGTETVDPAVLANADPGTAVVDWILLELRDATDVNVVVARRAALLLRNGDIRDTDGAAPVRFSDVTGGDYRLVVRHRNHTAIITVNNYALGTIPTEIDLTSGTYPVTTGLINPDGASTTLQGRKSIAGVNPILGMWGGNARNVDHVLAYFGAGSDRQEILDGVGSATPFNTISNVYSAADVNMDGKVEYFGTTSDRQFVLDNVGSSAPFNILSLPVE